ncbi:MAG: family metalloprotease domain protein, partial [Bacteroidetes bacterium]|nr:family metalloprotease domain protein [Bacteroidota bacterium]
MKKFLFLVILVTVLFSKAYAVPAYPGPIKYTQPDGSVITVQLKGDERVHWAESSDGYTLLSNGKNGWEYAVADQSGDIKASGILAREVSKRTLQELQFLKGLSKNI